MDRDRSFGREVKETPTNILVAVGLGWVGLGWVGEQSLVAVLDRDRSFGKDANKYSGGWHN